jgi:DNA-binding NarL/FixJ family response regulator
MWGKSMAGLYRLVLADNHVLFRYEVKKIIERAADLEVVGEVEDGAALMQFLEQSLPDLVIVDISLPHLRVMEATHVLKLSHPEVKVLIMIMDQEEEYLTHASRAGAAGVVLKQHAAVELLRAIRTVRAGKFYLAPQFRGKKVLYRQCKQKLGWGSPFGGYF